MWCVCVCALGSRTRHSRTRTRTQATIEYIDNDYEDAEAYTTVFGTYRHRACEVYTAIAAKQVLAPYSRPPPMGPLVPWTSRLMTQSLSSRPARARVAHRRRAITGVPRRRDPSRYDLFVCWCCCFQLSSRPRPRRGDEGELHVRPPRRGHPPRGSRAPWPRRHLLAAREQRAPFCFLSFFHSLVSATCLAAYLRTTTTSCFQSTQAAAIACVESLLGLLYNYKATVRSPLFVLFPSRHAHVLRSSFLSARTRSC
jgi:hypothetical protein